MPLPIIPLAIAGAAIVMGVIKVRPSTAVRLAEEGVLYVPRKVHKGAKNVAQRTKIEFRARMLDRMQQAVNAEAQAIGKMTAKQRRALEKEQVAIMARADELRASREMGTYYARRESAERRVRARHAPKA